VLNIGVPEMLVILVIALIVFGPNRLPDMARSMGKFIRQFQAETNRAISDLKQGIEPATTGVFDEPDPVPSATEPITTAPPTSPVPAPVPTRAPVTRRAKAASPKKPATAKKRPTTKRKAARKTGGAAKRSPRRA
jgi:TatA/E family protein of Tat protein translocase